MRKQQLTALAVAASLAVTAIPFRDNTPAPAPVQLAIESAAPAAATAVKAAAQPALDPAWDLPNLDHERVDYWVGVFMTEKGSEESHYAIADRLSKETRDYVPLMIAAARIAKEPAKYGFGDQS